MAALFAILYGRYLPLHSVFWLKTQAISSKKYQGIPTAVMAASGGNGANISTTPSAPSQTIDIPAPRYLDLPHEEYLLYFDYLIFIHRARDKIVWDDHDAKVQEILQKMTADQKRIFPLLAEDEDIINELEYARDLKESLEELVRELRLGAENEIDIERERC